MLRSTRLVVRSEREVAVATHDRIAGRMRAMQRPNVLTGELSVRQDRSGRITDAVHYWDGESAG